MKISPAAELKERTAALNTQLRFGRERSALMHAYQLRAFLQLRGAKGDEEKQRLEWVERVILGLEKRKSSGIQRLIQTIIRTAIASLTPENDTERTLLDQFQPKARTEQVDDYEALPEGLEEALSMDTVPPIEDEALEDTEPVSQLFPEESPLQDQDEPDEDWGWGGETVSSTPSSSTAKPLPAVAPPEEDHWGGSSGYNYDDKF